MYQILRPNFSTYAISAHYAYLGPTIGKASSAYVLTAW